MRTAAWILLAHSLACSSSERDEAPRSTDPEPAPPPAPAPAPVDSREPAIDEVPSAAPVPAAPPGAPFVATDLEWHGSAPVPPNAASERGRPRLRIEPTGVCLRSGDCLVPDGFPAVRTDGAELVVLVSQTFLYDDSTVDEAHTIVLYALELPALRVRQTFVLVDRNDAIAHQQTHSDCCRIDDEEGCDQYLCGEDPSLVDAVAREVRARVAERMRAANAYLRASAYRVLAPIASESGSTLAIEIDQAEGRPIGVRVLDQGRARLETSFPSASEYEAEDPHGWHDLATGLALVEVAFPTADERDYDGVELHYVAGMLAP